MTFRISAVSGMRHAFAFTILLRKAPECPALWAGFFTFSLPPRKLHFQTVAGNDVPMNERDLLATFFAATV